MNKVVVTILGILLVLAMVSAGCSPKTPTTPPTVPVTTPNTSTNTSGTLIGINPPSLPGNDVIVVNTPQGVQTLPITANTKATLEGTACTLDQIAALDLAQEAKVSYNCAIVYGVDENGNQIVVGLDVTKAYP